MNEPFIPDTLNWKRERIVRQLIKKGEFTIKEKEDLNEVRNAYKLGLKKRGRAKKEKN